VAPPDTARALFDPIAGDYERWARILSMGQDGRWRRTMVAGIDAAPGSLVLDVAAGTGSISRLLEARGFRVVALDQSAEMTAARDSAASGVIATGESLPFPDSTFDALTFGYLLRYVVDVDDCLVELDRVVKPGGSIGMVEFGKPTGIWHPPWWLYTRGWLPLAGRFIGSGWLEVGRFLGPSIERFGHDHPPGELADAFRAAGMEEVETRRMSLGGGLIMLGRVR
jgi:demethylmenaquinone methyltransferase/2-methoxy-6-polyprenyl-1,4-benzoquinol methylase